MFERAVLTLAVIALGPPCLADSGGVSTETQYLEDLPVVLTLSRLPQTLRDAPGAVTVIDAEMIRRSGYRDLGRLLRLVPGMQVAEERGGRQIISYHGLTTEYPNQMQVLVDGRSIYTPYFYGGADWSSLPVALEEIERIEVVRGSDSAAYGSNAFLGVVNIITRHSAVAPAAWSRVNLGSGAVRDLAAGASLRRQGASLRGDIQYRNDSGFDGISDDREQVFANVRTDVRVQRDHEFSLFAGLVDSRLGMGYANSRFNGNGVREATSDDAYLHLRWRYAPSEHEEWLINAYRNREQGRDEWIVSGSAGGTTYTVPVNQNRISLRDDLEVQHQLGFDDGSRLVYGVEWRRDQLDSEALFFDGKARSERILRLFANFALRIDAQWLLNIGLMAEDYAGDPIRFAPRIFANWQPDRNQSWRGGFSRAWRQPTLFERHGDVRVIDPVTGRVLQHRWIPSPDLRPQRIDALELGYFASTPAKTFQVDLRVFSELVSDLAIRERQLVAPPTNPLFWPVLPTSKTVNYEHAIRMRGLEYQLQWRPWRDARLQFTHSLIDRRIADPAYRSMVAPHTASLSWLQDFAGGWQGTVSLFRVASFKSEVGYDPSSDGIVHGHTSLDARIAKRIRFAGHWAELALAGTNLLGRHLEVRPLELAEGPTDDPPNEVEPRLYLSLRAEF